MTVANDSSCVLSANFKIQIKIRSNHKPNFCLYYACSVYVVITFCFLAKSEIEKSNLMQIFQAISFDLFSFSTIWAFPWFKFAINRSYVNLYISSSWWLFIISKMLTRFSFTFALPANLSICSSFNNFFSSSSTLWIISLIIKVCFSKKSALTLKYSRLSRKSSGL